MRLHSFIEKHLLKRTGISYLLYPLSLLYLAGHRIKQAKDRRNQYKAPLKVISIGNLTAGGSGKTPLGMELAVWLRNNGFDIAVSHRGYKGKHEKQPLLVTGNTIISPKTLGDEACLYATTLKDIPLLIGRDRVQVARILQEQIPGTQILILDDSFQNMKLFHDIDIVVISAEMGLGNGFCLPAGYLREPLSNLHKNHFVVLLSKNGSLPDHKLTAQIRARTSNLYFANLVPGDIKNYAGDSVDPGKLREKHLLLVSGIGNPASFEDTVRSVGLSWRKHLRYPDHYSFDDVADILAEACDYILCTQKDILKLGRHQSLRHKLRYIELALQWQDDSFERDLLQALKGLA